MNAADRQVRVGPVTFGRTLPFVLIAGPCAIESREHALFMAERLAALATEKGVPFVFKASFDKANRTSAESARGVGIESGLAILAEIRERVGCPVLTDVHESWQCEKAARAVDILQIPAFLCRQTDLLAAAAATGRVVNVKKGQFLAPWDMRQVAAKLERFGARGILLTERGVSFGYNTLVNDFRALAYLEETGWPVVFDATHSVQQPGGLGGRSGGERRFVPLLARAAVAVGVAALFVETHDDPDRALSDGPNMVPLDRMGELLDDLLAFDRLAKSRPRPSL
ncbi:MAG: 3-deoxy-8-phosphooctulonate synthase [Geminicoccaceae bacterium]|nr:3-deoxy-8-phosphooctulonate synthase [Geminicoccaceae bacterium]MCS7268224.1 3-deoxy-8-phosphooctulonate synthase [Geminicoccaceae bacterium]MCX7629420.1 3-deoxy-8-phosphooctulonate synthase [Geminicoccaceae bacterium]MDW8125006.1 3-deoxy-8-phosphooctulonate synthase [Geminicoccaceae bacterium]MDW8341217.1 3-deoxy-8-phosphooctulonate synthase [Geminicoccaceae bacterium]